MTLPQPTVSLTLEERARAELVALAPELRDDDAWCEARENLLRFFSLLEIFATLEDMTADSSSDTGEVGLCDEE